MKEEDRVEEKLMGLELVDGVFRMRVRSNGLTKKEHFEIKSNETGFMGGAPFLVTVFRTIPDDFGELVLGGTMIEYSYEELKTNSGVVPIVGDDIIVENLFLVC